jgi:hypothetical protein
MEIQIRGVVLSHPNDRNQFCAAIDPPPDRPPKGAGYQPLASNNEDRNGQGWKNGQPA